MTTVYISYRRKPSSILAQLIARDLGRNNIEVLMNTERNEESGVYPVEWLARIEACDVFICLVGDSTFDSEWVQIEIEHAHRSGKPMIPVFQESYQPVSLDRSPTPFVKALLEFDGVYVFDEKNVYISQAIEMLAKMIENTAAFRAQPASNAPAPEPPVTLDVQTLAGHVLGHYEIRQLIGAGGMSTIYRAMDRKLNRDVALKILSPSLAQQPEYIERFNREARTVAALEHPHIAPVYEFGNLQGLNYIAMRYLTGGSLAARIDHRLQTGTALPSLQEIAVLLKRIASALDYAHSRGVVHRDIKANNILFDNDGVPYLVDFGIAKLLNITAGLTGTGMAVGVPSYMAPEQWRGESITAAADQYALAVMTYYLVSGKLPFEADAPYGLMMKHLNESPPPISHLRGDLPPGIQSVLEQALAKEPNRRFPSVGDFADAFERAIAGHQEQVISAASKRLEDEPTWLPAPVPAAPKAAPTPAVDNLVGQRVGQYEVKKLLGIGGMGAIYQVYQPGLNRNVALKILLPIVAQDPSSAGRFAREAQIVAALEHPNIVPVHDFGDLNNLNYVVMRLLTGDTLVDRINQRMKAGKASLPINEISLIINGIANALHYAHSLGIIHRDVKANNVVFDHHGTPYLLDFSVALYSDTAQWSDDSSTAIGTPRYMAPEQWRASGIGPGTDQYGLAVTTYYLMTGQFPFDAPTPFALMAKHLEEEPVSPQVYNTGISQNVAAVVLKALAKKPENRYTNVVEFAQEFAKASAESPRHVFLSYSRRDKEYATHLSEHLKKHGFEVWIDSRIDYGDRWFNEIEDAINDCAAFLLLMTPHSKESEWVQKEILLAKRRKKPLFPLLRAGEEFGIVIDIQFANVLHGQMPDADFHQRLRQTVYGDT